MKNHWGADPEKYARLSEPFESEERMGAAANSFLAALGKLREQYKIPDLIVAFQGNVKTAEGIRPFYGGAGWGNQLLQAQLARRSADQEFAHLARVVSGIVAAYPDTEGDFITDPSESQ